MVVEEDGHSEPRTTSPKEESLQSPSLSPSAVSESAETESKKSEDKIEIESEEKGQLFKAENIGRKEAVETSSSGSGIKNSEVEKKKRALEEAEREGVKKRIPIGGIKIPGFKFPRSRDSKTKDGDVEEGKDLLQIMNSEMNSQNNLKKDKLDSKLSQFSKYVVKKKNKLLKSGGDKLEERKDECPTSASLRNPAERILDAIKIPLSSVIPCNMNLSKKKDVEAGMDEVGVAPVEILEINPVKGIEDDGLETVKLNSDEKLDSLKNEKDLNDKPFWSRVDWTAISRLIKDHKLVTAGVGVFLFLLLILIVMASTGPRFPTSPPVREGRYVSAVTSCGYVEGLLENDAVVFRGIPYAQPPLGDLRWKSAQRFDLSTCWNNTLKAHSATPYCWQTYANLSSAGSENCLTLDIITPSVKYYNPLPVVVLIGSETFNGGSPGALVAPPRLSFKREVLFVRINFRLGILGFLASESIKKTIHPPTSGNYGLSDILLALEWINLNIIHFGGDPSSVILLGHRVGGTLAAVLTTLKLKKPLFSKVWISNPPSSFPGRSLEEAEVEAYNEFIKNLNCFENTVPCLRKMTVESLTQALPETWQRINLGLPMPNENITQQHQWLVLDGVILQNHPSKSWTSGNLTVKVVVGTTVYSDYSESLSRQFENASAAEIADYVRKSYIGKIGLAEEALKKYGATWPGLLSMISDIRTVCPALASIVYKMPGSLFYVVNKTFSSPSDADADVRAILGTLETKTPESRRFVGTMQEMFRYFISFGTIKASNSRQSQVLFVDQDAQPATEHENCNFWINKDVVPRFSRIN